MIFTLELKLGIAGTAKNTGKTTVTAAIMDELRRRGVPFYLTSIGYDGENLDNVTGLPKPKLPVQVGDIVATAEKCLLASTARFETLAQTGVNTPLGRIRVVRVTGEGLVVTAGPNKSSEVRLVTDILSSLGPGVTLLDGALNRIVPMSETDGFILCTGASRSTDIPRLAHEADCILRMADLPLSPLAAAIDAQKLKAVSLLDIHGAVLASLPFLSLLSATDTALTLKTALSTQAVCLFVPGIIGEQALKQLVSSRGTDRLLRYLALVNPIKLLALGNPIEYYAQFLQLSDSGLSTGVLRRIPLLAVTVNPFYPEYRYETASYQPAYVDPVRLQLTMENAVGRPVYNVVRQGIDEIIELIMSSRKTWYSPNSLQA